MLEYVVLLVSFLSWIAAAGLVAQSKVDSMRAYAGVVLVLNLVVFLWTGFQVYKDRGLPVPHFDAHYSPFEF